MAFGNIQKIVAYLAERLTERLAGTELERWQVRGEVAAQLSPVFESSDEVPRVVLQAGAGSYAISGSRHRCMKFECESVVAVVPEGAGLQADAMMSALDVLSEALVSVMAEWDGAELVDPEDGVAAAYCVAASAGVAETSTEGTFFIFRQPFVLVIQF